MLWVATFVVLEVVALTASRACYTMSWSACRIASCNTCDVASLQHHVVVGHPCGAHEHSATRGLWRYVANFRLFIRLSSPDFHPWNFRLRLMVVPSYFLTSCRTTILCFAILTSCCYVNLFDIYLTSIWPLSSLRLTSIWPPSDVSPTMSFILIDASYSLNYMLC
jgi:hypothetical protein